jgi:hypothetical protein
MTVLAPKSELELKFGDIMTTQKTNSNKDQIRILFLAANPKQTAILNLEREYAAIDDRLRNCKSATKFRLFRYFKLRRDELIEILNDFKPHILHFSGHGSETGALLLEDEKGNTWPIDQDTLREVIQVARYNLHLVVLNSCYSHLAGQVLSRGLDCVIGMSSSISDETAVTFATAFYGALGEGLVLQDAFNQARAQIRAAEEAGTHIPVIMGNPRADDPRLIHPLRWLCSDTSEMLRGSGDIKFPRPLTRSDIRSLLQEHLPLDSHLSSFLTNEYMTLVRQYFTDTMDRVSKINHLLQQEEPDDVATNLETYLNNPNNPSKR